MRPKSVVLVSLLCLLAGAGVGYTIVSARGQAAAAPASGASPVVAEVNGEKITLVELERSLGAELDRLEQQIYEMKVERVEELVGEKLLAAEAKARGLGLDALLTAEVREKVAPASDAEVRQFMEANRERIPDQPGIENQVKAFLTQQKQIARHQEFVKSLRDKANVSVSLARPPVTRHAVNTEGAFSRGPDNAKITIVEFSDFHCPFCRRVQPALTQVLERYPNDVRLVYKDFPLDSLHPQARDAAEAARCAGDQGKFWEYHDALYASGPDASPAALKAHAEKVGLDAAAFERCLASDTHAAAVQRDAEEAEALGATGTPAFFINGRFVSGALPLDAFVRIIEDELNGRVRTR
ncbi:MAG: thioredoxin domain-containing protein [Vicinamibacteraceae bacterium]|nr:thioredoxin domain-containing protein [Vicinamibacteraceae bacterium]